MAFEGFTYNKDKHDSKSGKTYWKCDIKQCKGTIITDYDDRILKESPHSHGPDTPQIEVQRCMARLKEAVINSEDAPSLEFKTLNLRHLSRLNYEVTGDDKRPCCYSR